MRRGQPGVGGRGQQVMRASRGLGGAPRAAVPCAWPNCPSGAPALGGVAIQRVGLIRASRRSRASNSECSRASACASAEPAFAARRARSAASRIIGFGAVSSGAGQSAVALIGSRRCRATPTTQARSVPWHRRRPPRVPANGAPRPHSPAPRGRAGNTTPAAPGPPAFRPGRRRRYAARPRSRRRARPIGRRATVAPLVARRRRAVGLGAVAAGGIVTHG